MASLFQPAPHQRPARRRWPPRLDHALLVAGAAIMSVGSFMPWMRGQTRLIGYVDWSGIDDTGEGGMLLFLGLFVLAFVRWRSWVEDIEPRTRWVPLGIAVAAACLWFIPFRKIIGLTYDVPGGAQPQPGLFVAGLGVLVTLAGALLASRTWADVRRPPSGRGTRAAGGSLELVRGRDGYATSARVERRDPPPEG